MMTVSGEEVRRDDIRCMKMRGRDDEWIGDDRIEVGAKSRCLWVNTVDTLIRGIRNLLLLLKIEEVVAKLRPRTNYLLDSRRNWK